MKNLIFIISFFLLISANIFSQGTIPLVIYQYDSMGDFEDTLQITIYDTIDSKIWYDSIFIVNFPEGFADTVLLDSGIYIIEHKKYTSPNLVGTYKINNELAPLQNWDCQCVECRQCWLLSIPKKVTLGLENGKLSNTASIYPNPCKDYLNINLGDIKGVSLRVINISGHIIYRKESISGTIFNFEFNEPPSIYFVELITQNEKYILKLFKN